MNMEEAKQRKDKAEQDLNVLVKGADKVLQQPLTADKEETRKIISNINEAIEAYKVAHLDILALLKDAEAERGENEQYEMVLNNAKQVADALVDILVPAKPKPRKGSKESDAGSVTSSERQRLAVEVAALQARKEALSKKHELIKKRRDLEMEIEMMELEEKTSKAEVEEKLLKAKEEKEVTFKTEGKHEDGSGSELRGVVELLTAPKLELTKYNGDPLDYYYFMRSFEENVEHLVKDGASRLARLIQYCEGRAKAVIQSCPPSEEGYRRAKDLLSKRFGDPYVISQAWIRKVTDAGNIKGNDANALQVLADNLRNCYESLDAMGCLAEMNTLGTLARIVSKLPVYLQNRWRRVVADMRRRSGLPVLLDLVLFIEEAGEEVVDPVFGLSTGRTNNVSAGQSGQPKGQGQGSKSSYATGVKPVKPCIVCSGMHKIYACERFKSMGPERKLEEVRSSNLCFNCLGRGHSSKKCTSQGVCRVCGKKHHSLLHRENGPASGNLQGATGFQVGLQQSSPQVTSGYVGHAAGGNTNHDDNKVVLPIVSVYVKAPGSTRSIKTHALLDTGSTSSFCTEALLNALGIQGWSDHIMLNTMTGQGSAQVRVASLEVKGVQNNHTIKIPSVLARGSVPISPQNVVSHGDLKEWPHLQGIEVPMVHQDDVTLLIGQDVPEALIPINVVKGKPDEPYATQTALGWSINGPVSRQRGMKTATSHFVTTTLDQQVEQFWKLDGGLLEDKAMSINDTKVVERWQQEKSFSEGHYHLPIPTKEENPGLPDNRGMAQKRLQSLERKLLKDADMKDKYTTQMEKLLAKGYAEKVEESNLERLDGKVWYLPHHAVVNPNKPNIRVVFDCAAKYEGTSLNDVVHQGPDLTNNLIGVLLRFRQDEVAITADIESMFHQVLVPEDDRDLLRFLWWPNGDLSLDPQVYRMTSHLFGGTWSPSCCTFALQQSATDFGESSEDVQQAIMKNFYVDDLLKAVPVIQTAIHLAKELKEVLAKAGFNLTKWVSNKQEVIEAMKSGDTSTTVKELAGGGPHLQRALGVHWNIEEDVFTYKVQPITKPTTKRGILSTLSSVYDPLGHANPFILKARQLVQELFRRKIDWDDGVPSDIEDKWTSWVDDLPNVTEVKIPRPIKPNHFKDGTASQLHHFCDASELAYGVVTYVRSVNHEEISNTIVMAKGKLAPLKAATIPRLELAAAALAVKQDSYLRKELELPLEPSQYWTDSTIVIAYITNESKRFKTFVANRISLIKDLSEPHQWRHVESALNPADLVSRGLTASGLKSEEWLEGPAFLKEAKERWPRSLVSDAIDSTDIEVKKSAEVLATVTEENITGRLLRHFSKFNPLRRAVAWILAVKDVLTKKADPVSSLQPEHLKRAEIEIYKQVQQEAFKTEIEAIKKGSPRGYDRIKALQPVVIDGVLRVGGRLKHAALDLDVRHPIILPGDHHVTELIITNLHKECGHAGREYVLAETRNKFWIIGGRRAVKKVLNRCIPCKKRFAVACQQQMAELPTARTTPGQPPFTFCGVDYFGPFLVKRGRGKEKRYGCVFTCLTIRAVHIEVAHSLEADSFIQCLERFISRRGKPKEMYSDQGTNFTGANRELNEELRKLDQGRLEAESAKKGIKWKFNPPGASHAGGIWERMIRSIRKILAGLMQEQILTDESLSTLFCQVEAILNNRPITTISSDPQDLGPLTPNHLLLMREAENLPGNFEDQANHHRKRWRQIEYLANIFWKRWVMEYLTALQVRHKWNKEVPNLKIGDVILVMDHNTSRNEWLLGRVIEVLPGKDGRVRTVGVQTKKGRQLRPISKLCLLESA